MGGEAQRAHAVPALREDEREWRESGGIVLGMENSRLGEHLQKRWGGDFPVVKGLRQSASTAGAARSGNPGQGNEDPGHVAQPKMREMGWG